MVNSIIRDMEERGEKQKGHPISWYFNLFGNSETFYCQVNRYQFTRKGFTHTVGKADHDTAM